MSVLKMGAKSGGKPLKVLLIGKGGREHAIAWKISKSPILSKLFLWPGNPAMAAHGESVKLPSNTSLTDLATWARSENIEFVISGPEAPLSEGLADAMAKRDIPVFGPRKAGAMLESSKAFAKDIMQAAGIPTATSRLVSNEKDCRKTAFEMLAQSGGTVLKASGLAAGKGVFVCRTPDDIESGLQRLYHTDMNSAAEQVVIEEVLEGRECSYFTFVGAGKSRGLGFAVDYKRLQDGDLGPNTGGMGSYTPVGWLPDDAQKKVEDLVVTPLLKELANRDIPYTGCVYVGLMWHRVKGPQVIEFNVRLGDPEAQILAVYDDRDWLALMADRAGIELPKPVKENLDQLVMHKDKVVGVVLASETYPYGKVPGASGMIPHDVFVNAGTDDCAFIGSVTGDLKTGLKSATGRVMTLIVRAPDFKTARLRVYNKVEKIRNSWSGCQFRKDIGADAEAPL